MNVNEMNLSLNGCGYVGIYHVGVCACLRKYYPQVLRGKISGGSVGALVACAFMCNVSIETATKYIFNVSMKVRSGILGPMTPDLNIMKLLHEKMDAMLPDDAHLLCDGRLHVSVTRFDNGKNVLLNRFSSKAELLQALMCSCFIPVYCGYEPPVFHGVAYVDAALSNNSPCLNEHTVTVAPFSGNSDICPENDGMFLKAFTLSNTSIGLTTKNIYIMFRVLFPGPPDIQKDFCQKGYRDALRFLRDNGLVPCSDCVASVDNTDHSKCRPPDQPMSPEMNYGIESATEVFRQNLGYRLFQYRSMKMLYYMNIPSIVTAKVAYLVISAILQKVQNKAGSCVDDLWRHFIQNLIDGVYRQSNRKKFSGQLEASDAADSANNNECDKTCEVESLSETKCGYTTVTCSDGSSSESESSDVSSDESNSDLTIKVPQNISNTPYLCNTFPVQPKLSKNCQLDFPLCESKGEGHVTDILNTYVC